MTSSMTPRTKPHHEPATRLIWTRCRVTIRNKDIEIMVGRKRKKGLARAERPRAARKGDRSEGGGEAPAAPPRRAGRARPRSQGRVHHGAAVSQRLHQRDAIRGRREVPHRGDALSLGDRGAAGERSLDGGRARRAFGRRRRRSASGDRSRSATATCAPSRRSSRPAPRATSRTARCSTARRSRSTRCSAGSMRSRCIMG